jgi:S-adenosylmethionine decarboxylase
MQGLHLTADIAGCRANYALMTNAPELRKKCLDLVKRSKLSAVSDVFFEFPDTSEGECGGVTGTVLLAESHLAIHTWPELSSVTLDVYVCNYSTDNSAKARLLIDSLISLFKPEQIIRKQLDRGEVGTEEVTA